MIENSSESERTKSVAKANGAKKIKSSEFSLRVHLKGEVAIKIKNMANRATKESGYTVSEGLIATHCIDLSRGEKWVNGLVNYLSESTQHNA